MGTLRIGPEGFVDLRRNPPPDREVVNGWSPEVPQTKAQAVPIIVVPPVPPMNGDAPLPAIQKTAEGLAQSVAAPVKVKAPTKRPQLMHLHASSGHPCYVVLSRSQHTRLARHKWTGVKSGKMYRKVKIHGKEVVLWLHREAARCNKADHFVGFQDNDERNCTPGNLIVFTSKEELKAHKMRVLQGR